MWYAVSTRRVISIEDSNDGIRLVCFIFAPYSSMFHRRNSLLALLLICRGVVCLFWWWYWIILDVVCGTMSCLSWLDIYFRVTVARDGASCVRDVLDALQIPLTDHNLIPGANCCEVTVEKISCHFRMRNCSMSPNMNTQCILVALKPSSRRWEPSSAQNGQHEAVFLTRALFI